MRFRHPDLPGRSLRLAYCLNLHPAADLAGCLEGIAAITLPLRDALSPAGSFGIGMYLPAAVASHLASPEGAGALADLRGFLRNRGLDPFTFNAFPFGDFHRSGLKERVFEPTWCQDERLRYTLDVAHVAAALNEPGAGHVSISTHPGRFGPWEEGEFERAADQFGRTVLELARIEERGGPRIVLGLEWEPRVVAGDTSALAILHYRMRAQLERGLGSELLDRHLGTCLDTCHSAVEFEHAGQTVELATRAPLAKLQFSNAICLFGPRVHAAARDLLLALDEERYLHQTTGRGPGGLVRCTDLPELSRGLKEEGSRWLDCDQWRTHFHVPVDLSTLGVGGLGTTRDHAREILDLLLLAPDRWPGEELHLEIETYTWDILPSQARGPGDLIAGLAREYAEVLTLLDRAGWAQVGE